jgi:hypothetical protein
VRQLGDRRRELCLSRVSIGAGLSRLCDEGSIAGFLAQDYGVSTGAGLSRLCDTIDHGPRYLPPRRFNWGRSEPAVRQALECLIILGPGGFQLGPVLAGCATDLVQPVDPAGRFDRVASAIRKTVTSVDLPAFATPLEARNLRCSKRFLAASAISGSYGTGVSQPAREPGACRLSRYAARWRWRCGGRGRGRRRRWRGSCRPPASRAR